MAAFDHQKLVQCKWHREDSEKVPWRSSRTERLFSAMPDSSADTARGLTVELQGTCFACTRRYCDCARAASLPPRLHRCHLRPAEVDAHAHSSYGLRSMAGAAAAGVADAAAAGRRCCTGACPELDWMNTGCRARPLLRARCCAARTQYCSPAVGLLSGRLRRLLRPRAACTHRRRWPRRMLPARCGWLPRHRSHRPSCRGGCAGRGLSASRRG